MDFGTDDDRKKDKKINTVDYREELERQMRENQAKKRRAKEEKERYDARLYL